MSQKVAKFFECKICNYTTSKKNDYDKHILTRKHKILTNDLQKVANSDFYCFCGKKYKHRQSLNNHKKKCEYIIHSDVENNMISDLIQQNKELQETLINQQSKHQNEIKEIIPYLGNKTINNKINLSVFLNETCKDALNIDDFVKSMKITIDDLEMTREKGLLESVNNKIITSLQELEIEKRPIHCSDQKRRVMLIKDNNNWEKDDNHIILKNKINDIAEKQLSNFNVWENANPEYLDSNEGQTNYVQLLSNITKELDVDKDKNKIINSIVKHVII